MKNKRILITGGAGFIGSHLVRRLVRNYKNYDIYNLDALTYAGNLENIKDIQEHSNYKFIKGDILDVEFLSKIFEEYKFDQVIHLAAESHVDRSIRDPLSFLNTNIIGTVNLLNKCKENWDDFEDKLFYHISTDEVFGSLGETGYFDENTAYDPNSPYSASKASSDHFVRAYGETYGIPYIISNCSNNYGPNQFPEKLIPLMINNIINNQPLPVYGNGLNIRDWLFVEDHSEAIDLVLHKGKTKTTYAIGGWNEWTNIDIIRLLCKIMDRKLEREIGSSEKLITFVKDRLGHDKRYAINATKIKTELGWEPKFNFEHGIEITVDWYLKNKIWLENVTNGNYLNYYNQYYQL